MKVYIHFQLKEGAWGGGNQFLRALRDELVRTNQYTDSAALADVILFNSHHDLSGIHTLKLLYPHTLFVHRVDGPLSLVRGGGWRNILLDKYILFFSNNVADVTVFQSTWSYHRALEIGYTKRASDMVIHNASDSNIFNQAEKKVFAQSGRIRLIATSWSRNFNKGFETYKFLDDNLDFNKYEFVFVGNSPFVYKNIIMKEPLNSVDLAHELRLADIYITASKNDPCSNSLIEALSCGLPVVALRDGGHPELVGLGGKLFKEEKDLLDAIDCVAENYGEFQKKIPKFSITNITQQYLLAFTRSIPIKRKAIRRSTSLLLFLSRFLFSIF